MVKVQIVEEKEDAGAGNSPYASPSSSRTSSTESFDSQLSQDETLIDRIAALVDIVPPTTRHQISSKVARTASVIKTGLKAVGTLTWVLTTSAILVALPLALSLEDEARLQQQESEMMAQEQGAQQVYSFPFFVSFFSVFTGFFENF
jgi:mitochondrial import receptor subunit TOM22